MTFSSALAGFAPTLWWKLDDGPGATTAVNSGSAGSAYNASITGSPAPGYPSLVANDLGSYSCYQVGGDVANGWDVAEGTALQFGLTDSFSVLAVVASWGTVSTSQLCFSQQRCTAGAVQFGLSGTGMCFFRLEDTSAVTVFWGAPPLLNDGVPHLIGAVRDHAAGRIRLYSDGLLVTDAADVFTVGFTNSPTDTRLGHRFLCGDRGGFGGAYQHVAIIRSVLTQANYQSLFSELWSGSPPTPAASPQGTLLNTIGASSDLLSAKLDQILAAVRKTF